MDHLHWATRRPSVNLRDDSQEGNAETTQQFLKAECLEFGLWKDGETINRHVAVKRKRLEMQVMSRVGNDDEGFRACYPQIWPTWHLRKCRSGKVIFGFFPSLLLPWRS